MGVTYDAEILFGFANQFYVSDMKHLISGRASHFDGSCVFGLRERTMKKMASHASRFVEFVNFVLAKQNKDTRVDFDRDAFDLDWALHIGGDADEYEKNDYNFEYDEEIAGWKPKQRVQFAPIDTEDPLLDSYVLEWLKIDPATVETVKIDEDDDKKKAKRAKTNQSNEETKEVMNLKKAIKPDEDFLFVTALKNKLKLGFYVTYSHDYAFDYAQKYKYGPDMILRP